jgi:hypothetical protein
MTSTTALNQHCCLASLARTIVSMVFAFVRYIQSLWLLDEPFLELKR